MIDWPHPWSKGLWRCLIKNVSTVNNYVLIWVDRPTRLLNTWFGFLAFVIILLLRVCLWVNATFCTILRTAPWELGQAMVVAVLGTTSSLGFYLMGGRGDIEGTSFVSEWRKNCIFHGFCPVFLRAYEYVTGLSNVFWVVAGHYVCYCLSIFKTNLNLNIWYF